MTSEPADIARIARLEMAVRVLRTDLNGRLRETNVSLARHATGELIIPARKKDEGNGCALGYASAIDLVNEMMREHGISET